MEFENNFLAKIFPFHISGYCKYKQCIAYSFNTTQYSKDITQ